jgi:DeoR family transcriptional regulator, suf operon transcriptional repressor
MIKQNGSRQEQILTLLLNAAVGMSIDEIAAKLEISRNAVKQHLVVLEKQQLVREAALNSTGGRPARSYALTEQGVNRFPKQYAWFCSLLIDELATGMDTQALEQMMWKLGVKLGKSLLPQFSDKQPAEKLEGLVQLMQSLGYHAEIDSVGTETGIKAVNCVYHDLAKKHPEICYFDQALIATLLDKTILQTACMAKNDCACCFKLA